MRSFYLSLSQWLDANLLSIFVGMVSGAAINLCTGGDLNGRLWTGIGLLFLSVLFNIRLILMRKRMDENLATLGLVRASTRAQWIGAAEPDKPGWQASYFFNFFLFAGLLVSGVVLTAMGKSTDAEKGVVERQAPNAEGAKLDGVVTQLQDLQRQLDHKMDSPARRESTPTTTSTDTAD